MLLCTLYKCPWPSVLFIDCNENPWDFGMLFVQIIQTSVLLEAHRPPWEKLMDVNESRQIESWYKRDSDRKDVVSSDMLTYRMFFFTARLHKKVGPGNFQVDCSSHQAQSAWAMVKDNGFYSLKGHQVACLLLHC